MICKTTLAKKTLQLQNNLQKEILWSNTLGKCDILFPSTRRTSSHLDMLKQRYRSTSYLVFPRIFNQGPHFL